MKSVPPSGPGDKAGDPKNTQSDATANGTARKANALPPRPHDVAIRDGAACRDAALQYANFGWSPLQLCTPDHVGMGKGHGKTCASPGKAPFGPWKAYQDKPATVREITDWWRERPTGNVGIVMGPVSGVVGVDTDDDEGERQIEEVSGGDLPATLTFRTPGGSGGGKRRFYAMPPGVTLRITHQHGKKPHSGYSLLGPGSQTVAPPSRHPNGGYYDWLPGHGPGEIAIAIAPTWLVEEMRDDRQKKGSGHKRASVVGADEKFEANRNIQLTSIAGTLRRRGLGEAEILACLTKVNETRCEPPLPDDEVAGIARKICNYEPGTIPNNPAAADAPVDTTGYGITLAFFREYYQPVFRRGTAVYSAALGREVRIGEACAGAPIALIEKLARAADAPLDNKGNCDRAKLPGFFNNWCRSAWRDMIDVLPEEESTAEISDAAQEEFRGKVVALLHTIVAMGHKVKDGRDGATRDTDIQRRSLIDWCRIWAKPGRWAQARSYSLWMRMEPRGEEYVLRVALRVELFSQVNRQEKLTQNKFDRLASQYGLAECRANGKVNGTRCTILTAEFVEELLATPDDGVDERTFPISQVRAHA